MAAGDFESRWLAPDVNAVWTRFLHVTHRLELQIDRRLQEQHGITHTQYEILVRLADSEDRAMRMSDLADRIVTAKSAVTYQVNKLSDLGLVERHKCDRDNRGVWVKLTGPGLERLEQAAPCILSLVRELFLDAINCDQAAELDKLLGTWSDNLDEHDRAPIGHRHEGDAEA
ncbi:MarR family winged helix-turn-helix transcriptional regulator [Glycomyces sp. A-F 0318]|uniref:MarR family winged helix-turn-helix transcriptional regulator n=1 Tax=Glycomyces amatae TaxID=2881355 RepID=UPI001E6497EA|nr:MarR family winged helix-turn-helix transcriptional regulator [Glycomyces amatae]MCD0444524.1 MarR family winged helix-turn-helix transcriptional regulator [Glycomyces amatae]